MATGSDNLSTEMSTDKRITRSNVSNVMQGQQQQQQQQQPNSQIIQMPGSTQASPKANQHDFKPQAPHGQQVQGQHVQREQYVQGEHVQYCQHGLTSPTSTVTRMQMAAHTMGQHGQASSRYPAPYYSVSATSMPNTPPARHLGPRLTSPMANIPDYHNVDLETRLGRIELLITKEISGLKTYIDRKLNEKFDELRTYVDQEIERVASRVGTLENTTEILRTKAEEASLYDPENTIVADNLAYEENEDLHRKVETMIRRDLALNIPVTRVLRLNPRPARSTRYGNVAKPGLVKIQVPTVDDKIKILREKKKLNNSPDFSCVYLRSSKSHTDRLMDQNFRTILDLIPTGKDYRLTGNGRLVKKDPEYGATSNRNNNQD